MPELPEVETVVNTLRPRVTGRTIRALKHVRADMVEPVGFDMKRALRRRRIESVDRRAKRIVITLDDGNRFYIHLGMSGRLGVEPRQAPVEKHTHLILTFDGSTDELRFRDPRRFGCLMWMGSEDHATTLGPEPLALRPATLHARLIKTTRAVKNALLDQNLIAGLGNIYVDESLFSAGIHPLTRGDALTEVQVKRLSRAIKQVLRRAIRHRGSTLRDYVDADGERGGFQLLHAVYGREGEPCRKCRLPIERIVLGGRSTHFCARCQPLT